MRKLLLILAGITAAVGIAIGGWKVKEQIEHKQMVDIVKSDEAKKIYEERLKQIDADAFTEKGVIQSYKIEYDSVTSNPMGGIIVNLYVNGDREFDVSVFIHKNSETGELENGGGSNPPLEKLKKGE
ncbi:DUF1310 family protein [Streptococcus sp. H31]|uniref:DUF1310 family protein n=1 Tax=Streptococcus huangxiaojuni TaxID=3237239 RepID=UPI0034A13C0C